MASKFGVVLAFMLLATQSVLGNLIAGFYEHSCPQAELIIRNVLRNSMKQEPRTAAFLLRMHFHDCFVNGCDGSVLLDDTPSKKGEKTANPNRNSLAGFEVIDAIKSALEHECPQVVSCADILAVAARDSVVLTGGPSWEVVLGRKDSKSASLAIANRDIPAPNSTFSQLVTKFSRKGLSAQDMIVLSGSHTIGRARCASITQRLYNFQNTGRADPSMDAQFLAQLKQACPQGGNGNATLPLDLATPLQFDSNYYKNVQAKRGLLNSDQVLQQDASKVLEYGVGGDGFFEKFAAAMLKMGNIAPKTGRRGEIRTNCRFVNSHSTLI